MELSLGLNLQRRRSEWSGGDKAGARHDNTGGYVRTKASQRYSPRRYRRLGSDDYMPTAAQAPRMVVDA